MCKSEPPRPNTPEARRQADETLGRMKSEGPDPRPNGPWTAAMRLTGDLLWWATRRPRST